MPFSPPHKILKISDDVQMEFVSYNKTTTLYTYRYLNGFRKGATVEVSEAEIIKQLTNYWEII